MSVLLDTNICIALLNGRDGAAAHRLRAYVPRDVLVCSVVKAELIFGARNSQRVDENMKRLAAFFSPFEPVPFDDVAAEHYGVIRSQLEHVGTPIGANDMMIAAIAMGRRATVVTRNTAEFNRVAGLRVEVW